MDITIGIRNVSREITIDVDMSADEVAAAVADAIAAGTPLSLTDTKGRGLVIPTDALGYVLTGSGEARRVGFGV